MAPPPAGAARSGPRVRPGRRHRRRAAREKLRIGPAGAAPAGADAPPPRDRRLSEAGDTCRVDVWLWRARFFKTRSLAARIIEQGGVRLSRGGARTPLDKPSRSVRCGDVLTFAQGPRWLAVKSRGARRRRGPATEARTLYSLMDGPAPV